MRKFHSVLHDANKSVHLYHNRSENKYKDSDLDRLSDQLQLILSSPILHMLKSKNFVGAKEYFYNKFITKISFDNYCKIVDIILTLQKSNYFKDFNFNSIETLEFKYNSIPFPKFNVLENDGTYYYFIVTQSCDYNSFKHLCNKYGLHYLFGILKLALSEYLNQDIGINKIKLLFIEKESPHLFNEFKYTFDSVIHHIDYVTNKIKDFDINSPIVSSSFNIVDDLEINF